MSTNYDWQAFDCPGSRRWRTLPDGHIEIENEGAPTRNWVPAVDQWKENIVRHATTLGMTPAWLAALMSIESGGNKNACARIAGGGCNPREGVGLMAILASTASLVAGRQVTQRELLEDPDLNIALGAKFFKTCLDKQGGDPVKASVQYNAGSVRCGQGRTWVPEEGMPREQCPRTDWNVVEGCVTANQSYAERVCAPSQLSPGKYVCSIDRPRDFIKALNSAIDSGWGTYGTGTEPVNPTEPAPSTPLIPKLIPFVAGMAFGYVAIDMMAKMTRKYVKKHA